MWGCISIDNVYTPNFSVGYTSMKSDVVIHLAQWQYWWWFWFSFLWAFYYLTTNKVIRTRVLKFRPKIYTSYRSHGKWGDFLACIVPAIWCLNILTNSSFILRLMEWQNESSLFNVRVRARQWYWIYKFELRNIVDIISVPKNIGTNRWLVSFGGAHEVTDNYYHALKLRNQNTFFKKYWNDYIKVMLKSINNSSYELDFDNYKVDKNKVNTAYNINFNSYTDKINLSVLTNLSIDYPHELDASLGSSIPSRQLTIKNNWYSASGNTFGLKSKFIINKKFFSINKKRFDLNNLATDSTMLSFLFKHKYEYVRADNKKSIILDNSRFTKKITAELQPILLTKELFNSHKINNFTEDNYSLLNVDFNKEKTIKKKLHNDQTFFVIKQKRYKLKRFIPLRIKYKKTDIGSKTSNIQFSDRPFLSKLSFINQLEFESTKLYQMMKKNKARSEVFSVQLSRRLLRTRKTLVLPAHVNLTLITNSYDVIHSWFIPSLGVKMDCVPGRSTHHTFYVDNVGFFYGQCAEICGRYHHHMPIRLCMLPYEHFFVWWQHFGLPKLLNTLSKAKYESDYSFKLFNW